MSAWICSKEHFARLANGIKRHEDFAYLFGRQEVDPEARLLELINTLIKANHYAVNCRYTDRRVRSFTISQETLKKFEEVVDTPFQVIKLIHCLSYQCSEGDTDIKFKKTFAWLQKVELMLSESIIRKMDGYESASWGTN